MATKEEILSKFDLKEGAWFAYNEGMRVGYNEAYNSLHNQAAIAALQGVLGNTSLIATLNEMATETKKEVKDTLIEFCIETADVLITRLRKEK